MAIPGAQRDIMISTSVETSAPTREPEPAGGGAVEAILSDELPPLPYSIMVYDC